MRRVKVTQQVLNLVSEKGFDKEYNKLLNQGLPPKIAFGWLNGVYKQTYGIYRYSSYDSYRITRSRRIKARCN